MRHPVGKTYDHRVPGMTDRPLFGDRSLGYGERSSEGEDPLGSTARDPNDLTVGLRDRLSDAEPTTYVSLENQLRRAVFERLIVQAEEERQSPRRGHSSRRGR